MVEGKRPSDFAVGDRVKVPDMVESGREEPPAEVAVGEAPAAKSLADSALPPADAAGVGDLFERAGEAVAESGALPGAPLHRGEAGAVDPPADAAGLGHSSEGADAAAIAELEALPGAPLPAGGVPAAEIVLRGYEGDYISTERPVEDSKTANKPEGTIVAVPAKANENNLKAEAARGASPAPSAPSLDGSREGSPAPSAPSLDESGEEPPALAANSTPLDVGGEPRVIRVDRRRDPEGVEQLGAADERALAELEALDIPRTDAESAVPVPVAPGAVAVVPPGIDADADADADDGGGAVPVVPPGSPVLAPIPEGDEVGRAGRARLALARGFAGARRAVGSAFSRFGRR